MQIKIEEQRKMLQVEIDHYSATVKQQDTRQKQLEAQILELKSTLIRKEDVEANLSKVKDNNLSIDAAKSELHTELTTASSYIIELEDKFYKQQRNALELLKQLKLVETSNSQLQTELDVTRDEISAYRSYILELKQRVAVYVPIKTDNIDRRIAEYINNYPDRTRLKVMFVREAEGVYKFGSKRVNIKIDKDKINIRVGGGYMTIDEFIDQFTGPELERLERTDPMRKFGDSM